METYITKTNTIKPTNEIQDETKGKLWDSIEIGSKKYNFCIFSPGGNDTCLIEEMVEDKDIKKYLNDKIMELYPNVEQVGFIDISEENPRLEMAGGEFCGNATRSFVYRFFDGKEGNGLFKISGVQNMLQAGVDKEGEARAEMPIYKEFSRIQEDVNSPGNYIVEMEGITQYISFGKPEIERNDEDFDGRIKEESIQKIKALGLDRYPAAGIIYVTEQDNTISIDPVVYVKSINTLFYETACGSGSVALGLVLAAKKKESIENIPIRQPSGVDIKISVTLNDEKNEFVYAQIQGEVKKLKSGNFEKDNEIMYAMERIRTKEELDQALNTGELMDLYKKIFSEAPYFEKFSDKEVEADFQKYINNGVVFIIKKTGKVIGFGASVPLKTDEGVMKTLEKTFEKKGWDIDNAWYMADVGVKQEYRNKGFAKKLVLQRLQTIPKGSIIIMRTSVDNDKSRSIYENFGFKELKNIYQNVVGERQDDEVKADQRRFSYAIK